MSTTTIRLPADLKARIQLAAERDGTSVHAFIVEAIARRAAEHEERDALLALGQSRWEQFLKDGKTISIDDIRRQVKTLTPRSHRR